jgi:hypothetical protein
MLPQDRDRLAEVGGRAVVLVQIALDRLLHEILDAGLPFGGELLDPAAQFRRHADGQESLGHGGHHLLLACAQATSPRSRRNNRFRSGAGS